jgi:phosphoglycolate phosphatase-like HAD superfamily hydrolase
MSNIDVLRAIESSSLLFWDFDGVIKDSVDIKTSAYERLFEKFPPEISLKIRRHHINHGGVSRYDKIPLYLSWTNESLDPENINHFCEQFSSLVKQSVIDSPWVLGVKEYLLLNSLNQRQILVTATPQDEMEEILKELKIYHCFSEIYGAPKKKIDAIRSGLNHSKCLPKNAFFIGDAETDLEAAEANSVPFILRCTYANKQLQDSFYGLKFSGLIYE